MKLKPNKHFTRIPSPITGVVLGPSVVVVDGKECIPRLTLHNNSIITGERTSQIILNSSAAAL